MNEPRGRNVVPFERLFLFERKPALFRLYQWLVACLGSYWPHIEHDLSVWISKNAY